MKTCPYCDSIISVIGVKNCPNCGATLGSVVEPENTSHIQPKPKPEVKPQPQQQNNNVQSKPRSGVAKVFFILTTIFGTLSLFSAIFMLSMSFIVRDYKSNDYDIVKGKIIDAKELYNMSEFSMYSSSSEKTVYDYTIEYTYNNEEYTFGLHETKTRKVGDEINVYVRKNYPADSTLNKPSDIESAAVFAVVLLVFAILAFSLTAVLYLIAILLLIKMIRRKRA